ncbi:MAG: phosphoadenosine phosphosulfate reductase family protein [Staphylothermus sp.]|nr:phosphoadenosine phosphosulfate reductase family protein [Staphylothermus sp.]
MIDIIVRSRRDANAVKSMMEKFYPGWDSRVYTLHGKRNFDKAIEELENIISKDRFYVLMLAREDAELARELEKVLPSNVAIQVVPRSKIRNTRIEHLSHLFDIARSKFRLAVGWIDECSSYVFELRKGVQLEKYDFNPAYDVFLGIGEESKRILEKILSRKVCSIPLFVRRFGGKHYVYCGYKLTATLNIPDYGIEPNGKIVCDECTEYISVDNLLTTNKETISTYAFISKKYLEKYRERVDTVIVPWSGGKDSTAALLLALEVFPKKKIKVIYVDTGADFPVMNSYVEYVSRKLGIDVIKAYANIDKLILNGEKEFPTHDNRWCTGKKIEALENKIKEVIDGNTLVITGDRDAESERRSLRPASRVRDENYIIVSPIKVWGGAHVQLYILSRGLRLNPLYEAGFYRIGCYMCPALRSWELYIMLNNKRIYNELKNYELFKIFLNMRINQRKSF